MKEEPFAGVSADLRGLVDGYCAGTLTPEELAHLETLLRSDPRSRLFLAAYLEVHAGLHWGLRGGPHSGTETLPRPFRQDSAVATPARLRHRRVVMVAWMSVAVILLVCAVFVRKASNPQKVLDPSEEVVACFTKGIDARWAGWESPIGEGSKLASGPVELVTGMAEIEFRDGGVLLLEAPVRLELTDRANCILKSGRVVLRTSESRDKLTVHTATARIDHLGTEFGLAVESDGTTLVQVYEGTVRATLAGAKADFDTERTLHVGESLLIDPSPRSSPRSIPFAAERFVRAFPPLLGQGAAPCNKPKVDTIRVLPAPGGLEIDGDLSDWNLSGQFRSACEPPFDQKYVLEGAMMYDAERLYIGAHVRDPAAMRNVLEPETDAEIAWRGGALQVRLSCDRQLGWPVLGQNHCLRDPNGSRPPVDANEKLAHLTLWWSAPKAKPCLHVQYGMDFNRGLTNPPGFRAAFRKDGDQCGYTLEYAIPWRVLNAADDPPRGGDVSAACWTLHWSDEGGRLWHGHLIDLVNRDTTGLLFKNDLRGSPFLRAEMWGKAIYEPPRDVAPLSPP